MAAMAFARFMARQLARPSGLFGRLCLAPLWNRRNSALNDIAFDQLVVRTDDRVIEIGFGGGYLLDRIAQVATDGFLAGVDASQTMAVSAPTGHIRGA
jgi:arsenite methyltransferase